MEEIDCPICKVRGEKTQIKENGYTLKKCPNCGLMFISPRPTQEEIHEMYENYRENRRGESVPKPGERLIASGEMLNVINKYAKGCSLLDVGAGTGKFSLAAHNDGYVVRATELDKYAATYIREELGIPCKVEPLSDSLYNKRTFDVIHHRNVMSHLRWPVEDLKRMNRLLNDDGLLVYETGDLTDVNPRYYDMYDSFQFPDHLFFLGSESTNQAMNNAGFKMVEYRRYNIIPKMLLSQMIESIGSPIADMLTSGTSPQQRSEETVESSSQSTYSIGDYAYQAAYAGYDLLREIAKYKAGRVIPTNGRPQTVIVAAKKIDTPE